jgi:hypothetical protein
VRQHFSYEGEHQERVVAGVTELSTREWVNIRCSEDNGIQTEVDEEVDEEVELEAYRTDAPILNQTHIITFRNHFFYEIWVLAKRIIGVLGRVLRTHARESVRENSTNTDNAEA